MEIHVELLNEKMREIVADRERSYSKQFAEALKQVVKSFKSVEKAARKLEEAVKRAWGRLSRPAEQHGVRLSELVLEACQLLSSHAPEISYEELRKFEERSLHATRSITKTYSKYARSIIRPVKPETLLLESSIADLSRSVNALSKVLDKSNLKQALLLARDAEQLAQNASQLRSTREQARELNEALGRARELQSRLQDDLSILNLDENLKELSRIELLTRRKEAEALALLEPLSKPLRKADRPDSKLSSGPSRNNISKLAEDPLNALLEIPVLEMRELLASLRRLIEHNEILLDQRRKRKSIESIQSLEAGALERIREEHSILQANRQEILRQLKGSGTYDRWLSLQNQLDSARAEADRYQSSIEDLQSQEARLRAIIVADKARIETALQEVQDEQVSIIVSF
jgi:hypothetical protein